MHHIWRPTSSNVAISRTLLQRSEDIAPEIMGVRRKFCRGGAKKLTRSVLSSVFTLGFYSTSLTFLTLVKIMQQNNPFENWCYVRSPHLHENNCSLNEKKTTISPFANRCSITNTVIILNATAVCCLVQRA